MYIYIAVLTFILVYVFRGYRCRSVFSFCLNKRISKVSFKYHRNNSNYSWFLYQLCFAAIGIINFSKKLPFFIFASDTQQTYTSFPASTAATDLSALVLLSVSSLVHNLVQQEQNRRSKQLVLMFVTYSLCTCGYFTPA